MARYSEIFVTPDDITNIQTSISNISSGSVPITVTGSANCSSGTPGTTVVTGAANRGLAHQITITNSNFTNGSVGLELFSDAAMTHLLYKSNEMEPGQTYNDYNPFWITDEAEEHKIYAKVTGYNISSDTPSVSFTIKIEKYS